MSPCCPLNRDAVVGSLPDAMLLYKPVRRSSLRALIDGALPPNGPPVPPLQATAGANQVGHGGLALRVLVAEDNAVNQVIVQAMLAELGVSCRVVEDGQAALKALSKEEFDVVLMDVQMPVMDGLTATIKLREEEAATGRRRTPVVAMTANVEPEAVKAYRAAGMDDVLAKPFGVLHLRRLLMPYAKAMSFKPTEGAK